MEEILIPIAIGLASQFIQHGFNRSDFDYTLSKTNIPAQVAQFKQAGLNPALAYGQLSAPQGQSLGNYQGDFMKSIRDYAELPQVKQDIKTKAAEERYYNSLSQKTDAETSEIDFRVSHQEDKYKLDFEKWQLENIGLNLQNTNTYYRNIGQLAQNTLTQLQSKLLSLDISHYEDRFAKEMQSLVAATSLHMAYARTENALRDARLAEIQQLTKESIQRVSLMASQRKYYLQLEKNLHEELNSTALKNYEQRITDLYLKWLTKNGTDFSRMDQRERWSTYGPVIMDGVKSAIYAGALIGTRGLAAPVLSQPQRGDVWSDYGPGRDHLGH